MTISWPFNWRSVWCGRHHGTWDESSILWQHTPSSWTQACWRTVRALSSTPSLISIGAYHSAVHFVSGQSVSARTVCVQSGHPLHGHTAPTPRRVFSAPLCIKFPAVLCITLGARMISNDTYSVGFIFGGGSLAESEPRLDDSFITYYTYTHSLIYWVVLVFRTWAIWGQSRKVAIGLAVLFVVVVAPLAYLTEVGLTSVKCSLLSTFPVHYWNVIVVAESPVPHIQSCFVITNHDITILWDYIVILAFETGKIFHRDL